MATLRAYPVVKNLATNTVRLIQENTSLRYINDGAADDFPARMITYVSGSVIAAEAVEKRGQFLLGAEIIGPDTSTIVNSKGETLGAIIEKCILDYALFERFFVLVMPNKTGRRPMEIFHTPAEYVRMGLENEMGVSECVYASPFLNTEDGRSTTGHHYPIYSFDPRRTRQEINEHPEKYNGEKYKGHMLVFQKLRQYNRHYSRPKLAYGFSFMEADNQQGQFIAANLRNNFFLGGILWTPGDPDEQVPTGRTKPDGTPIYTTRDEIMKKDMAEAFSGAENSGAILTMYFSHSDQVGKFERPETDRLHEVIAGLDAKVIDKISLASGIHKIFLGERQTGQLGNNQQMVEIFNQTNQFFKKDRESIFATFSKLLQTNVESVPLSADTVLPDIVFNELQPNEKREYIRQQYGLDLPDLTPEEIAARNPIPQPNDPTNEDTNAPSNQN